MRANYANMKKRYCQKLGEQILWEDNEDFVPVQGTGIGPRSGPVLNKAQDYEEDNEQELSELPQRQTSEAHRDGQKGDEHSDARDFIRENRVNATKPSRRPRSAANRPEFSEPKCQSLSRIMRIVQGLLRRNHANGSRTLDLGSFRMGEDSAEFVSGVVKQHLIVSLKLTNCAFTDACVKHLSQALMDLKEDNALEVLFLGVNRLSPAGVQDLCSWMQWSQSLLVLDLQLNNFGDEACIPLAAALKKNCHLQALNLQGNAITAQGVALLVHALSQNEKSCIQEVFLGFNLIGDDGAHHLREVVSGNIPTSVHTLCLCKCQITDIGAKLILEASSSSLSPLRRVDLSYNTVSTGVMKSFQNKKILWVNLASAIDVSPACMPVPGIAEPTGCDARVCLTDGPLETKARERQAEEARRASQSSYAARKHLTTWRNMPAPIPKCQHETRPASAPCTVTLQCAATLGPLYGGRLRPADVRGGGMAGYSRSNMHALGAACDAYGITLVPQRGAIKMGEGLDFLKDHRERGTVYGNIMGAEEGLRAVAHGVGAGKAANRLHARGLKGAPVNAWLGKGV